MIAGAFLLLVLILPYSALESFFVDSRIAIAVVFVLIAAIRPKATGLGSTALASLLLLLLVGSRSYVLAVDWSTQSRNYEEVLRSEGRRVGKECVGTCRYRW